MSNYDYAIKMGSSNTIIVSAGQGVLLYEPSVIAITTDKKQSVKAVGHDAIKLIGRVDANVKIVEPVKDGVIKNKHLATLMLKEFLHKIKFKTMFTRNDVVMLVPCSLDAQEQNEYLNIAYSVGFTTATLLPTAIAGLVNMEVEEYDTRCHLLCSLGGGVCDISIISAGKIIAGCTVDLGGKVLDYAIKHYLLDNYHVDIRETVAEEIKIELATLLPNDVLDVTVSGVNSETHLHEHITVTSQQLRPLFVDYFTRVSDAIEGLLNSCSPEVVNDINKRGVYLFGALSQVTGLERFMRSRLNLPVYVDIEPDNTVAMGATTLLNNPKLLANFVAKFTKWRKLKRFVN